MTWIESQFFCYKSGGHLAEIHSELLNIYLTKNIPSNYGYLWIGATALQKVRKMEKLLCYILEHTSQMIDLGGHENHQLQNPKSMFRKLSATVA